MSDTNIVIVSGRCTKAPEVRYTANKKEVGALSIECIKRWDGGERKEYIRVIGWGQMAQQLAEVRLGDYVIVTGEWSSRSWEKEGVKQRTVEVNAQAIAIVGATSAGSTKPANDNFNF